MKLSQASALRSASGSESDMLETNLIKGSHHILVQRFEYKKKLMLMLMLKVMLKLMVILMLMLMLMLMVMVMVIIAITGYMVGSCVSAEPSYTP